MLSRLYDERVFTSSDDVVFSESTSQALLHNGDRSTRRASRRPATSAARRRMVHSDLLEEEEEESKSDRDEDASSDEQEVPADDEEEEDDDDEDDEDDSEADDEEVKKRTAGLKFPLQSPRHIAASQSYLHHQRQDMRQLEGHATSPATRRRQAKKLLDGDHNDNTHSAGKHTGREGVVTVAAGGPLSKELARRKIHVQYHDHPMELVYLSTGEIRPRDECPPGLRLPATTDGHKLLEAPLSPIVKEKLRRRVESTLDESTASSAVHITRQAKDSNGARGERGQRERPETIVTTNGDAKKSKHGQMRERAAKRADSESEESDNMESDFRVNKANQERHKPTSSKMTKPSTRHGKTSAQPAPQVIDQLTAVAQQSSRITRKDPGGGTFVRRDQDKIASAEEDVEAMGRVLHSQEAQSNTTRDLEAELQKEKKRVLQKMTQLLEEQGKTQALQHQVQMLQDKIASMEKELEKSARLGDMTTSKEESKVRERDERIRLLSEEVRSKDDLVHRLQSQLEQSERSASTRNRVINSSPKNDEKVVRLRQREAAIAKQLEELMRRVTEFHSQVECWKVNSRDALEACNKRTDVLELMDRLWMDFPPFISTSEASDRKTSTDGESSTIAFLTKKLRQKEEELRVTHVKYVELKELCARQCIREADLQNFINEHRLRGNLVIRKTSNEGAPVNTRVAPSREQENQQVRSNGVSNELNDRRYGDQEAYSDDGEESDVGADRIVQRPKVFIDIKRSNHQNGHNDELEEQSPIEHVRLAPSPALAQRYRQQQATMRQGAARTGTARASTVSTASRTLATRQALITRTSTTQKRSGTAVSGRPPATGRLPLAKTVSTRGSVASRRPSQAPLASRPWV